MVLKMAGGTGFDVLADNLRSVGLREAEAGGRRQQGGADLIASTDPTITPELQYVVLLADQSLVVSSDSSEYAGSTAGVAAGGADSFASVAGVPDLADRMGDPANAMVWGKDFACTDLAMSGADDNDQARAEARVELLGGVTPLSGRAMAMQPDRTLRVVEHFESSEQARKNLRPRARLAVGEAIGRGGSFADDLALISQGRGQRRAVRPEAPDEDQLRALGAVRRSRAVRHLLRGRDRGVSCGAPRPHKCCIGTAGFASGTAYANICGLRLRDHITPNTSAAGAPPPVDRDQVLLEVPQGLVVGRGGLGPGAVLAELPAGGVRVEGQVEEPGDLVDLDP